MKYQSMTGDAKHIDIFYKLDLRIRKVRTPVILDQVVGVVTAKALKASGDTQSTFEPIQLSSIHVN